MKTSERGLALIREFEGLRLAAYQDAVGVWTIGYGTTRGVKQGQKITAADAESLLRDDLARFESEVMRLVKVPLSQPQFDALVVFTYNLGAKNLGNSTLLRRLNAGDYKGAAGQFERWNKAGGKVLAGLTRRRAAERKLFESSP